MFTGNCEQALIKKGTRSPGCLQRSHTQTLLTPVKIPDLFQPYYQTLAVLINIQLPGQNKKCLNFIRNKDFEVTTIPYSRKNSQNEKPDI